MHIALYTGCHKKIFRILREGWMILSKTFFWILKLVLFISTSFKKEISILNHIAQKFQARQYLQNCL
jgi:hypothetical protein